MPQFKCTKWYCATFMSIEYRLLFVTNTCTKFILLWGGERMITIGTIQCQLGFLFAFRLWHLLFPLQLGSWKWSKEPNVATNPARIYFHGSKTTKLQSICFLVQIYDELGLCFIFKVIGEEGEKKCIASRELLN